MPRKLAKSGRRRREQRAALFFGEAKKTHKRSVKTGTPAFVPYDVLKNPIVVETAIRNNITPTAAAAFTQSLILRHRLGMTLKLLQLQCFIQI